MRNFGRAHVEEDHRLARTLVGPVLDLAIFATAGQPPIWQQVMRREQAQLADVLGYAV
jgi:hypothetical protein